MGIHTLRNDSCFVVKMRTFFASERPISSFSLISRIGMPWPSSGASSRDLGGNAGSVPSVHLRQHPDGRLRAVGLMIGGKPRLVTGLLTFGLHPASRLQGRVDSSLCPSVPTDWEHPCLWKPSAAVCGPSWNCHPHSASAGRDGGREVEAGHWPGNFTGPTKNFLKGLIW